LLASRQLDRLPCHEALSASRAQRLVVVTFVGLGQPMVHLDSLFQEKGRPKGRSFLRSIVYERLHVNARGSADRKIREKMRIIL